MYKILAIINLVVVAVIITDTFVIKPIMKEEVFHIYTSVETRTLRLSSHWTNFIITASGSKYQEPQNTGWQLQPGDKFIVAKSYIFRRPIQLIYSSKGEIKRINCGGLNENYFELMITLYVMLISLIQFFKNPIRARINLNERLIFSGSSLLCVVVFFYFF